MIMNKQFFFSKINLLKVMVKRKSYGSNHRIQPLKLKYLLKLIRLKGKIVCLEDITV